MKGLQVLFLVLTACMVIVECGNVSLIEDQQSASIAQGTDETLVEVALDNTISNAMIWLQ
jgi:hypothetical protein